MAVGWLLIIAGCGGVSSPPKPAALRDVDRARLAGYARIHAIHYPPVPFEVERSAAGAARSSTPAQAGAIVGAVSCMPTLVILVTWPLCLAASAAGDAHIAHVARQDRDALAPQDPISLVKARFLAGANLPNAEPVDDLVARDVLLEQGGRGNVVLFDFRTVRWRAKPTDPEAFVIQYAAEARLLMVDEARILWRGVCDAYGWRVDRREVGGATRAFREAADMCGRQLVEQFKVTE
jgi:hypothetical protein